MQQRFFCHAAGLTRAVLPTTSESCCLWDGVTTISLGKAPWKGTRWLTFMIYESTIEHFKSSPHLQIHFHNLEMFFFLSSLLLCWQFGPFQQLVVWEEVCVVAHAKNVKELERFAFYLVMLCTEGCSTQIWSMMWWNWFRFISCDRLKRLHISTGQKWFGLLMLLQIFIT